MNWKDLGKKIAGIGAPIVGGMLGGPAGAAVGKRLAGMLGVEDRPEAVEAYVAAHPEAAARLREIEATK